MSNDIPMTDLSYDVRDPDLIRAAALRNIHYHSGRRLFFDRLGKFANFAIVLLGAGATSSLTLQAGIDPVLIGASIAFIGGLQLVYDLSGQARNHQLLQKEYVGILADIERCTHPDYEICCRWIADMVEISAEEPPIMRALMAKAHNTSVDAMACLDADQKLIVPFWQSFSGYFFSHEGYQYQTLHEYNQRPTLLKWFKKLPSSGTPKKEISPAE